MQSKVLKSLAVNNGVIASVARGTGASMLEAFLCSEYRIYGRASSGVEDLLLLTSIAELDEYDFSKFKDYKVLILCTPKSFDEYRKLKELQKAMGWDWLSCTMMEVSNAEYIQTGHIMHGNNAVSG